MPRDVIGYVEELIAAALAAGVSDIHLTPAQNEYEIRRRTDGLMQPAETVETALGKSAVTRLMVLAKLLTYRLDVPQEGRATITTAAGGAAELRVSVIPTLHGLRCAVRLPVQARGPAALDELGLPEDAVAGLRRFAAGDAGMLVVTGPAGSGKTTTVYALLRHLAAHHPELSVVSLEDPVESAVPGVAQIEVSSFGGLTYERALRSILRQDPQVLALGEVRDAATASVAVQAALSGHRLVCTMHAATAGGAIGRLLEMGLEPYRITSALTAVLNQRLLRRKSGTGYAGRVPVATWTVMTPALRAGVLELRDAARLDELAGGTTLRASAQRLIDAGVTDGAEVERALGAAG